jgi:hypothetical protein
MDKVFNIYGYDVGLTGDSEVLKLMLPEQIHVVFCHIYHVEVDMKFGNRVGPPKREIYREIFRLSCHEIEPGMFE